MGENMGLLILLAMLLVVTPAFGAKPHQLIPTDCSGATGILLHRAGLTKEALFLAPAANGRECLYLLRKEQLFKATTDGQESVLRSGKLDGSSLFVALDEKTVVAPTELWPPLLDRTIAPPPPPQGGVGALPDMDFNQYDVAQRQPSQELPSLEEEGSGTILQCDGTAEFAIALAQKRILEQVVMATNKGKLIDVFLLQRRGVSFLFQRLRVRLPIFANKAIIEIEKAKEAAFETIVPQAKVTILGPTIRVE